MVPPISPPSTIYTSPSSFLSFPSPSPLSIPTLVPFHLPFHPLIFTILQYSHSSLPHTSDGLPVLLFVTMASQAILLGLKTSKPTSKWSNSVDGETSNSRIDASESPVLNTTAVGFIGKSNGKRTIISLGGKRKISGEAYEMRVLTRLKFLSSVSRSSES